jgi:hypothetical protein
MEHTTEYRKNPAFSQSDLKLFEENLTQFHKQKILGEKPEKKYTAAMELGDIVDALLTQPDKFDEIFYVYGKAKVSDTIKSICDMVFEKIQEMIEAKEISSNQFLINPITAYANLFLHCARNVEIKDTKGNSSIGYQNNYKDDTLTTHVMEKAQAYFEEMKQGYGKKMIHVTDHSLAHVLYNLIKEDEYCYDLLRPLFEPNEEIEILCQLTLYGEVENHPVKGILDLVVKNNEDMTIKMIDAKVSDSPTQFKSSYKKFKYYRQGALYSELLRQNYPEYTVLLPVFLVSFKDLDYKPELYEMGENDYNVATYGGKTHEGFPVKGYIGLLHEIQWHLDNDKWDHNIRYYNKGKNTTNIFKNPDAKV